jgi:hypothetical protein
MKEMGERFDVYIMLMQVHCRAIAALKGGSEAMQIASVCGSQMKMRGKFSPSHPDEMKLLNLFT